MASNFSPIGRIKQPNVEDLKVYDSSLKDFITAMYASGGTIISGVQCAFSSQDPFIPKDTRTILGSAVVQETPNQYAYIRARQDKDHTNAYAIRINFFGTLAYAYTMQFSGGTLEVPDLGIIEHKNPAFFNEFEKKF